MRSYECRCLYCDRVTGSTYGVPRFTVGGCCTNKQERSEARELAAGLRPWSRPLSFWVGFFNQTPVSDAEARDAKLAWDQQQQAVKEFNDIHYRADGIEEVCFRTIAWIQINAALNTMALEAMEVVNG